MGDKRGFFDIVKKVMKNSVEKERKRSTSLPHGEKGAEF